MVFWGRSNCSNHPLFHPWCARFLLPSCTSSLVSPGSRPALSCPHTFHGLGPASVVLSNCRPGQISGLAEVLQGHRGSVGEPWLAHGADMGTRVLWTCLKTIFLLSSRQWRCLWRARVSNPGKILGGWLFSDWLESSKLSNGCSPLSG